MATEKPLHGSSRLEVNRSPVQRPDQPHLLRESRVTQRGVPTQLVLHRAELEVMLDHAKHSLSGRCLLLGCELVVRLYRDPSGVEYEQWTVEAVDMRPEMPAGAMKLVIAP